MRNYAVANIDEIDEQTDGRCPWRPIRAHFGVMSFGATTWTARAAGDRLINEHDEPEEEELYLVTTGRAVFELDGDRVEAPGGTFVFAPPGVHRTAFAEEAGNDDPCARRDAGSGLPAVRLGVVGAVLPVLQGRLVRGGRRPRARRRRRESRAIPGCSTTSPAVRASRVAHPSRSSISTARSSSPGRSASSRATTRTSTRFAASPASRRSSRGPRNERGRRAAWAPSNAPPPFSELAGEMSMAEVTIAVESPLQDEVRTLIAELNAYLLSITPPEFCSHMTVEQMAGAETTVFVAPRRRPRRCLRGASP